VCVYECGELSGCVSVCALAVVKGVGKGSVISSDDVTAPAAAALAAPAPPAAAVGVASAEYQKSGETSAFRLRTSVVSFAAAVV
jgi:hypothetical protein